MTSGQTAKAQSWQSAGLANPAAEALKAAKNFVAESRFRLEDMKKTSVTSTPSILWLAPKDTKCNCCSSSSLNCTCELSGVTLVPGQIWMQWEFGDASGRDARAHEAKFPTDISLSDGGCTWDSPCLGTVRVFASFPSSNSSWLHLIPGESSESFTCLGRAWHMA